MSEFKVGDKVELLVGINEHPAGTKAEVVEINTSGNSKYLDCTIRIDMDEYDSFQNDLKLIPEYKTLAKLWGENDRRQLKAVDSEGHVIDLIGISNDRGVFYCPIKDDYDDYLADRADWQLYQEPEEKPAEKCEHDNTIKYGGGKHHCKDCKVWLVEKWLWWFRNDQGNEELSKIAFTEKEMTITGKTTIIKKASNSRELFEVSK